MTHAQLVALGYGSEAIRHRLATGRLHRVRPRRSTRWARRWSSPAGAGGSRRVLAGGPDAVASDETAAADAGESDARPPHEPAAYHPARRRQPPPGRCHRPPPGAGASRRRPPTTTCPLRRPSGPCSTSRAFLPRQSSSARSTRRIGSTSSIPRPCAPRSTSRAGQRGVRTAAGAPRPPDVPPHRLRARAAVPADRCARRVADAGDPGARERVSRRLLVRRTLGLVDLETDGLRYHRTPARRAVTRRPPRPGTRAGGDRRRCASARPDPLRGPGGRADTRGWRAVWPPRGDPPSEIRPPPWWSRSDDRSDASKS